MGFTTSGWTDLSVYKSLIQTQAVWIRGICQDGNYTRIIKNGGEYSDKFKIKATKDTSYFTDTREKIDGAQLSRGDDIRAIVELRYIWLNNGKFGATWVALQIQQRSNSFAEIEFVDSDDDEQ